MVQKAIPKLAIFDTFKTKGLELTGEAERQRSILFTLATKTNPAEKTRTAISQTIAEKHGVIWKNIYSGIFRDLDEILIPLGFVEEEGRLPLKRGPKALQEKGIPYYHLTKQGLLVALSIKEVKNKRQILKKFFEQGTPEEKEFATPIIRLSEISPSFTFSIFERYVKSYCEGRLGQLLPFDISNLRSLDDEMINAYKEFLEGIIKLSKQEKQATLDFLKIMTKSAKH
ncbi:MAG: hypothetical protein GWN01_07630 [Nitrosopumilaceae archaeon]|nr:hypothetical protein [Nitrosopumilaceae archaeon]NIU00791.1 hypothetical protein [Nitrosopumilaceae archaeon]NIU87244.1 hypothetical protein [Nitrosopumilaceae archaeon]NIV65772.1 hypothetical protein [Nitrosopumilaceae archaeon]NIX61393.1 hypothetical protein [Nitrosopumilaceae archaeon]